VLLSLWPLKAANTLLIHNKGQIASQLPELERQKMIDAPLILIFRMGLGACLFLFCIEI
jgi:hypothetical protein